MFKLFNYILFPAILSPLFTNIRAAEAPDLRFRNYTIHEGLSNNSVYSIAQDEDGFIWFGTDDGLNRFDGCEFVQYHKIMNDSTSLPGDVIFQLLIDRNGMMWIATNQGMARYNRKTDAFVRYKYNSSHSLFQTVYARVIHEDRTGNLLVGTSHGIFRIDEVQICLQPYTFNNANINTGFSNVRAIFEDSHSVLWIGSSTDGLFAVNQVNGEVIHYNLALNDETSDLSSGVISIYEDVRKTLWIGTKGGLFRFERNRGRFQRVRLNPSAWTSYTRISFYCLFEDQYDNLWLGTEGSGLLLYQNEKDEFIQYVYSPFDQNCINNNYIHSIFLDRQNILWAGTMQNGINFAQLHDLKPFRTMRYMPGNPNSLNSNVISAIYEDSNGHLYVGTDGGGLNIYDKNKDQFKYYMHDPLNNHSIGSNAVLAICEDSDHDIWIGGYNCGLSLYNEADGSFQNYKHDLRNPQSISNNDVRCIHEDIRHQLWIATNGGGLNLFDKQSRRFSHFRSDANDPSNTLCSDWTLTLMEDVQRNLWIGTYSGLSRLDLKTLQFTNFYHDENDSASLCNNWIYCLLEDQKKNIWIGTSNGLSLYNRTTHRFTSFYHQDGLPSNTINGILEDQEGNLWLSTNNGICRFNTATYQIKNYDEADGLQGKQFMHGAQFKNTDGELFFGGMYGLTHFKPEAISENDFVPPVRLTGFQLFYEPVSIRSSGSPLPEHISRMDEITLNHNQSVITFNYAALNFISPEKNQYAYYLEGFDRDWHYVGTRREATYTNLNPGKYIFRVKGSNNDGLWNDQDTSIRFTITPPFWKTWLFKIALIFFIGGITLTIFKLWISVIDAQRKKLEKEVAERTAELKRSHEDLAQFTYVAFHDLQEPIRTISSYSSLLERELSSKLNDNSREFLYFMKDGALRMQQLIEGLLQFIQVTTAAKPFSAIDCSQVVRDALSRLEGIISDTRAKITVDPLPTIQGDASQIETVFLNLLLNGLKYTKPDHRPVLHVSVIKSEQEWIFSIKDNGIGIDPEYQERIFGIFKRLHTREEYDGIGIGLPISKKIIERHKGRLWVESKPNYGSTFYFSIPYKSGHFPE